MPEYDDDLSTQEYNYEAIEALSETSGISYEEARELWIEFIRFARKLKANQPPKSNP